MLYLLDQLEMIIKYSPDILNYSQYVEYNTPRYIELLYAKGYIS